MPTLTAARHLLPRRPPPAPRLSRLLLLQRPQSTSTAASTVPTPQSIPEVYPPPSPPPAPAAETTPPRLRALRAADPKPFSAFLTDRFSRQHNYLRISITERCNLRCLYCMPSEGVTLSPASHLLSTPEILELARLFVSEGVTKIRLTGGEPTVRRDFVELVEALGELRSLGLREIAVTTNGVAMGERRLQRLVDAGLTGLNVSLDTLVPAKFEFVTRRKGLERVLALVETAGRLGFGAVGGPGRRTLKLNVVVMRGVNEEEIVDFVEMTKERELEVRFIEYMPFDGNKWAMAKMFPFADMLSTIKEKYPDFTVLSKQRPNDTAKTYHVPGFKGKIGFITSMTENFCGSCNRLRITCDGNIKACLFGNEEVSLRDMIRQYRSPEEPFGAGKERTEMEKKLLEIIGGAVGRKEKGHKPAEEIARGENRPMILIDKVYRNGTGVGVFGSGSIPLHLLPMRRSPTHQQQLRLYSSSQQPPEPKLPHLTSTGEAHMVPIHSKPITTRTAIAEGTVLFSSPTALSLIASNANKKGDVLAISRISGIMAAKKCSELVVLCHPIPLSSVEVEVVPVMQTPEEVLDQAEVVVKGPGERDRVAIRATVTCEGKTGVEMEALTAVMGAALAVVDMCKAVDRGMEISGVRVVSKTGGRSGDWGEAVEGNKGEGEKGEGEGKEGKEGKEVDG